MHLARVDMARVGNRISRDNNNTTSKQLQGNYHIVIIPRKGTTTYRVAGIILMGGEA